MKFDPAQLQQLVSQAQEQARNLQQKMKESTYEASAGGGAVSVKINGQKQLLSVTIDPEAVKAGDVEMIQDMVVAAVNEAGRKADAAMQSSLGGMLGGMNIPGL